MTNYLGRQTGKQASKEASSKNEQESQVCLGDLKQQINERGRKKFRIEKVLLVKKLKVKSKKSANVLIEIKSVGGLEVQIAKFELQLESREVPVVYNQ